MTAELLEILSTPLLSHVHCPWSKPLWPLSFLHKFLDLASSLYQSLLHTTTRLCFINASQIVILLHQTQQRLSFVLRIKSRFLTLTYEGLYVLFLPHPLLQPFIPTFVTQSYWMSLFLYQVSAQKAFLTFHPVSLLKEVSDPRWLGFDPLLCFSLEPCASPITMGPMLL